MRLFGILIIILVGLFEWIFTTISYDSFINYISVQSGYHKIEKIQGLISVTKFQNIKFLGIPLFFVGLFFIYYHHAIERIGKKCLNIFYNIIKNYVFVLKRIFKSREGFLLLLILIVNLIVRTFYLIKMPISYDEAWTYLNFTSKGFLVSCSYYPAPNNHVLHSILTVFTSYFPFDPTINLRIPSFLLGFMLIVVFFAIVLKVVSGMTSMILTAIFSFLPPILYYSYESRGYILSLLSFLFCFNFVLKSIQNKYSDLNKSQFIEDLFIFYFMSVVGFYTIPSFLYPFATLTLILIGTLILKLEKKKLGLVVFTNFAIVVTTCILYTPIILFNGLTSLTSNNAIVNIERMTIFKKLFAHFNETFYYFFSTDSIFIMVLLISTSLLFLYKNKKEVLLCLVILFISFFIPVLHSTIPFPRTWIYLIIPSLILMGMSLDLLIHSFLKKFCNQRKVFISSILVSILIIGSLIYNFDKKVDEMEYFSIEASKLSQLMISKNIMNIYINHSIIETYILYSYKSNTIPINLIYSRNTLIKDILDKNLELDSIKFFLLKESEQLDFIKFHPILNLKKVMHFSDLIVYERI